MAEQRPFKPWVRGSSPRPLIPGKRSAVDTGIEVHGTSVTFDGAAGLLKDKSDIVALTVPGPEPITPKLNEFPFNEQEFKLVAYIDGPAINVTANITSQTTGDTLENVPLTATGNIYRSRKLWAVFEDILDDNTKRLQSVPGDTLIIEYKFPAPTPRLKTEVSVAGVLALAPTQANLYNDVSPTNRSNDTPVINLTRPSGPISAATHGLAEYKANAASRRFHLWLANPLLFLPVLPVSVTLKTFPAGSPIVAGGGSPPVSPPMTLILIGPVYRSDPLWIASDAGIAGT